MFRRIPLVLCYIFTDLYPYHVIFIPLISLYLLGIM